MILLDLARRAVLTCLGQPPRSRFVFSLHVYATAFLTSLVWLADVVVSPLIHRNVALFLFNCMIVIAAVTAVQAMTDGTLGVDVLLMAYVSFVSLMACVSLIALGFRPLLLAALSDLGAMTGADTDRHRSEPVPSLTEAVLTLLVFLAAPAVCLLLFGATLSLANVGP